MRLSLLSVCSVAKVRDDAAVQYIDAQCNAECTTVAKTVHNSQIGRATSSSPLTRDLLVGKKLCKKGQIGRVLELPQNSQRG